MNDDPALAYSPEPVPFAGWLPIPLGRAWVAVAVLLSLLTGCQFGNAMRRGDDWAASGNWEQAMNEYEQAVGVDPDSVEARQKAAEARRRATVQAQEWFDARLQKDDFTGAASALSKALQLSPDNPLNPELATRLKTSLSARTQRLRQAGESAQSYLAALEAVSLVLADLDLEAQLDQARQTLFDEAQAATLSRDFQRALDTLRWVLDSEEAYRADAQTRMRNTERTWATDLAGQAETYSRNGDLGVASLFMGAAAALSGANEQLVARDLLLSKLLAREAVALDLTASGDRFRTSAYVDALQRAFADRPGLVFADPARHQRALRVALDLTTPTFDETWRAETGSLRYISDRYWVSNPEYVRLSAELEGARQHLDAIAAEGKQLERENADWLYALQNLRNNELQRAQERFEKAKHSAKEAQEAYDEAQKVLGDAQARLEETVRAQLDAVDALAAVQQLQDNLDARAGILDEREQLKKERRRELNELLEQETAYVAEIESRNQRISVLNADAEATTRQHNDLLWSLGQTAELLEELVYSDFVYEIQRWTRRCQSEALLALTRSGTREASTRFTAASSTEDTRHAAFLDFGIDEDPLVFPLSDDGLIQENDNTLLASVHTAIVELIEQQKQALIDEALSLQEEPARAVDRFLLARGLDPSQSVESARQFVAAQYGEKVASAL